MELKDIRMFVMMKERHGLRNFRLPRVLLREPMEMVQAALQVKVVTNVPVIRFPMQTVALIIVVKVVVMAIPIPRDPFAFLL